MRSIEWYLQHADGLSQEVVDAWEQKTQADNAAPQTEAFKELFDKACQYQIAKSHADRRRNRLTGTVATC